MAAATTKHGLETWRSIQSARGLATHLAPKPGESFAFLGRRKISRESLSSTLRLSGGEGECLGAAAP